MRVIGLFSKLHLEGKTILTRKFYNAMMSKANPRTKEYMSEILRQKFPDGQLLDVDEEPQWKQAIDAKTKIILLYPDSIGLGFGKIEKRIKNNEIFVLNGRNRFFKYSKKMRLKLSFLRILEKNMVLECLLIPIFIIILPVLFVQDSIKGRR